MKFKVALYPSEEGVAVCVPSLPDCWSQGETIEEALENIAVAIREYLEADVEPAEGAASTELDVFLKIARAGRRQSSGCGRVAGVSGTP